MANARRSYTREFKLAAVQLITEQNYSVAEAARRLGLSVNLLHLWKKTLQASGDQAFPGQGVLPPLEEENRLLRADNKRLRMERDILMRRACAKIGYSPPYRLPHWRPQPSIRLSTAYGNPIFPITYIASAVRHIACNGTGATSGKRIPLTGCAQRSGHIAATTGAE